MARQSGLFPLHVFPQEQATLSNVDALAELGWESSQENHFSLSRYFYISVESKNHRLNVKDRALTVQSLKYAWKICSGSARLPSHVKCRSKVLYGYEFTPNSSLTSFFLLHKIKKKAFVLLS